MQDKGAAEQSEAARDADEREPHHALNNPASDPVADEWPDPYDRRPDPLGPDGEDAQRPGSALGAVSTSEPHPRQDPEADPAEAPERDKLDP